MLTSLESAIKKESLSSNFVSAKELLGAAGADDQGSVDVLPWIPKTVSAVALRLSDLDASIIYVKPAKPELIPEDEKEQIVRFLDHIGSVKDCGNSLSVYCLLTLRYSRYAELCPCKLSYQRQGTQRARRPIRGCSKLG